MARTLTQDVPDAATAAVNRRLWWLTPPAARLRLALAKICDFYDGERFVPL